MTKSVSEKLKQLQMESGLTIYAISRGSGVPELTLTRILRGENTTVETLERLSVFFKINIKDFFYV